jgi:UPF0176 protein
MSTVAGKTILNIASYKFVALTNLPELRGELRKLCNDLQLRGTIMLSPEGINMFVAGEDANVRLLLNHLRQMPAFEDLDVKESFSNTQPFNRMLVKLKREIIAFGIDEVKPAVKTSPKLPAKELMKWLREGRKVRLLDTRNVYEVDLGTFRGAEHLHLHHFRDFPKSIKQLPDDAKDEPLVMFCTGGIRCEKAGPMMEQAGFKQVYQLDGGILKYFEECGGEHYEGACFVFDNRVALDPDLKPTGALLCFACQAVITHEDVVSPKFKFGEYCPHCYTSPEESYQQRVATRQRRIDAAAAPLPGSQPYDNYRKVHVPGRYANYRLIDFLDDYVPMVGRQQWLDWILAGYITHQKFADGNCDSPITEVATAKQIVANGECFTQHLPGTMEPDVNAAIQLLHEDSLLVVVNKPAPLPSHPSGRFNRNTLDYIVGQAYRPEKLRLTHRLDANTTGVMIFCRKHASSRFVQPQFAQQSVEKLYLARVFGHPAWDTFTCEAPIADSPGDRGARLVVESGKEAVTEFRVLSRSPDNTSVIEVRPRTGRTNQIRVHLWHLGYSIVGDSLYLPGHQIGDRPTQSVEDSPMCLHAWKITLLHPEDRKAVTYTAPPPAWF